MVESTVLRKLRLACTWSIDLAVVSSVRRDLFRDRSKSQRTASSFTMDHGLELVLFPFPSRGIPPPNKSVGYNRNVSKVSAHAPERSRTHFTPKRSMWRKRSPPKRAIMSSISLYFGTKACSVTRAG